MAANTIQFAPDGTLVDNYDGSDHFATWNIENGYLNIYYSDEDRENLFLVHIELEQSSGTYYLYFGDLEEGFEGGYWVFISYEP